MATTKAAENNTNLSAAAVSPFSSTVSRLSQLTRDVIVRCLESLPREEAARVLLTLGGVYEQKRAEAVPMKQMSADVRVVMNGTDVVSVKRHHGNL